MKVLAEKRKELSQTIALLIGSMIMEPGCRRLDFYRNVDSEVELYLFEEWESHKDLKNHLMSECFKVLRGAMNLLQQPCEIQFHTRFHPVEDEDLRKLINPTSKS